MPFIIPSADVAVEGLVLDGLNLAQGPSGAIQLDTFTPPIPKKRPEWIEAADSDGAILARDPLVANGQATIKLGIAAVSRDDAQTIIGSIVDKLEEADRNPQGIPLVWTPSGSTPTMTFYVLTGEVTEFPVDWESGYMAYQPSVTITLDCRPYGHLEQITITGTATAGPLVTLDLPDIPGDVSALGDALRITDSSSQSRRTVEWGAEYLHHNPASPTTLVLDSDSLVISGFAGTQTTRTGAYDPGGAGNSIITTTVASAWQAACGTGAQAHIGTFRVKARLYTAGVTDAQVRFAWRAGDGDYRRNDPVAVTWADRFGEIDLGLITVPETLAGTQTWDGIVEMYSAVSDALELDYLMLIPVEAGYGKATASYTYSPGVVSARDSFAGLGSGSALSARTPDVGAAWVTSGVATDFVGSTTTETTTTQPRVQRSTATIEAEARAGVLGGVFTNVQVTASVYTDGVPVGAAFSQAVAARYVDDDNYLWLRRRYGFPFGCWLELVKKVAGVETTIGSVGPFSMSVTAIASLTLVVFASGRAIGTVIGGAGGTTTAEVDVVDSVLAAGGALDDGKSGIADQQLAAVATVRKYDDVSVSAPPAEPIVLHSGRKLEIRHDSAERESSAGGSWGRPQSYRGSRFYVQPAGSEDRTTRVVAKASRNDLATAADDNLTDQILLTAVITPRCSVVPRA